MSLKFKWLLLGLAIILLEFGVGGSTMEDEEEFAALKLRSPASHVALSGDLVVSVANSDRTLTKTKYKYNEFKQRVGNISAQFFILRVLYLLEDISELIGEIEVRELPLGNETVPIIIPCGYFARGGIYALRLDYKYKNSTVPVANLYQTSEILDVKWPLPTIFLESQRVATYPSKPVRATVKYDGVRCSPSDNVPVALYILQLVYCGSSLTACYLHNNTYIQILHDEEVRDFLSQKTVFFRCELFGLPGNYAVRLKAAPSNPTAPNTSVYFKVSWSSEFKLTVHARSIYPCEGSGGVSVLFEYPSCRLEGDRIRVYGRLKADVTSVASPSSLHYISESRSLPGKHSLAFDCDLFTEKFVEYCFVYVSQAITNAMGDVTRSCVPTFPFQEGDAAGWGPWSQWSPCSSSCFGGVRNRYRFCDTPPPKYGAKFCQGKATETELCGKIFWKDSNGEEWRDRMENSECRGAVLAAARPEIGVRCRCGCRISLKDQSVRKILGANTRACPGQSLWLLQTQANFIIGLHLDQLRLPCPGQYFRVRDGKSFNADLLMDVASDKTRHTVNTLISSGTNLFLEFYSDNFTASEDACVGGFLAHAAVLDKRYLKRNGTTTVVPFETSSTSVDEKWISWKPAHLATALLLILMFVVSIFLTLQFVIKYRKYRIAEDLDSLSDISELIPDRAKCLSTSTIISEVISMIEMSSKPSAKETLSTAEELYNSSETLTGCKDESTLSSSTLKLNNAMESSSDKTITSMKSTCDKLLSASSILVYNKPQVKYAYPVKLQPIDYDNADEKESKEEAEDENAKENKRGSISKILKNNEISYSEGKESSPESVLSSSSTLASGKETKERRNREKLLQGPGSEFSLANPDSELELDYYDYNVANASAVPGSYLGMDPAFLVWIPPIDDLKLDTEELIMGSKRNSILALETEGAALTPSEYRRMKLSSFEDFSFELEQGTRTFEKLLPVQKILEDSSIKVSMESVSGILEHKQYCVISNRRVRLNKDEESSEESNSSKSLLGSPINVIGNEENNKEKLSCTPTKMLQKDALKQHANQKKICKSQDEDAISVSSKYKELMECAESYTNIKDAVNIPMTELSGSPLKHFAQVRKLSNKHVDASANNQKPDCGMETYLNQSSFFDQNIRFVDDDEDEYVD